jgi:hypothetical protein
LIIAAAVGGAAIVGIVFATSSTGDSTAAPKHDRPAASPTRAVLSSPASEAVTWAGRQLPHDATVLADDSMRAALTAAGFNKIVGSPAGADYVIGGPSAGAVVRDQLAQAAPIAAFGSGNAQETVGQLITDLPADFQSDLAADRQARATAETQLLANPALQATGNALDALRDGTIDLRAATVLAFLANSTHVTVLSVVPDAPEQAVGLPIRELQLRSDDLAATQMIIATLPMSYRPSTTSQLPSGALDLVWPIAAVPPVGLN